MTNTTVPLPASFLILSDLQSGTMEVCHIDVAVAYAAAVSAADNAALRRWKSTNAPRLEALPDCRTCANYDTTYRLCEIDAACADAGRYEPMPPVRFWSKRNDA